MVKGIVEAYSLKGSNEVELKVYDKDFCPVKNLIVRPEKRNLNEYLVKNFPNYEVMIFEYTKEEVEQWQQS